MTSMYFYVSTGGGPTGGLLERLRSSRLSKRLSLRLSSRITSPPSLALDGGAALGGAAPDALVKHLMYFFPKLCLPSFMVNA